MSLALTTNQLTQWCVDNYHPKSIGHTMNSFLIPGTLAFDAVIALGGYLVGHFGIPATWTAIKVLYAKIRGTFSGSQTPSASAPVTQ